MNAEPSAPDRRAALDERQAFVAGLLASVGADQLLILERPNLHWLCGLPITRSIVDPNEQPAILVSGSNRTIVCCNIDSQRIFDVYLDDLGFLLKEWHWHQSREQLLADLCANHKYACDRLVEGGIFVADRLNAMRLTLDKQAQMALRNLAHDLSHAIEATCRTMQNNLSEREAAGQLGHRLLHRGIEPLVIHVAADGRFGRDFRPAFTSAPISNSAVLVALGQRDGLHAVAARSVSFGDRMPDFQDFENASQIAVARIAAMTPGSTVGDVLAGGQRTAAVAGHEHAWHESPAGHFLGWKPVELPLLPNSTHVIADGQALANQSRINAALCLDTLLMTADGPELLTNPEDWPLRRYKLGERIVNLADVLQR